MTTSAHDPERSRLEELHAYDVLDTPPEQDFDDLVQLAARVCGTPISLVSLVDAGRQWFKARVGIDVQETPREVAFCAHAIGGTDTMVVPDARKDDRFAENPYVVGDPGIRFYAGVPLRGRAGSALGTLCVLDTVPRSLDPEQERWLRVIARQVMARLELRRALAEARAAEARHRAVIDALHEGVIVRDATGAVVSANESAERLLGREALARGSTPPPFSNLRPDGSPLAPSEVPGLVALRTGQPSTNSLLQVQRIDGTRSWVNVNAVPILGVDGRPSGVVVSFSDVTELRASEQRYRDLFDHSPGFVCTHDLDGTVLSVNAAAATALGVPAERLVGRPIGAFMPPENRARVQSYLADLREHGLAAGTLPLLTATGEWRGWSFRSVLRRAPGQPPLVIGYAQDVTEQRAMEQALRESEARFRGLFEQVPIGVYRTTPEGAVLEANPALLAMLGYEQIDELRRRDLERESESTYPRALFRQRLETEGQVRGLESDWRRRDGTAIHVRESARLVRAPDGRPLYYDGTAEDVTARRRVEELRQELLGIAAHELRTPLTSIGGVLQLVAVPGIDAQAPDVREAVEAAVRNCGRMSRLIDDLLEADKLESGEMPLDATDLPLDELVAESVATNRPYAEQFGVAVHAGPPSGATVRGDRDRLLQVLANLVSNAAKFSGRGTRVTLDTTRHEGRVRVSVADQGPGIPEGFRSRIFQRFAQARESGQVRRGSGLGLAISKSIVEALGGRIGFETGPTGTTFWFELPEAPGRDPHIIRSTP
jgi:PAS domain S-box-containing protein